MTSESPTVVLVHGAPADGSSWNGGMVLTGGAAEAPAVTGLVHVAASIPELDESLASINARYPTTSTPPRLLEPTRRRRAEPDVVAEGVRLAVLAGVPA